MSSQPASVQAEQDVAGTPTEVLIQTFADRILVVVTQLGKVGSLVQATMSSAAPIIPPVGPVPGSDVDIVLPEPPASIVLSPLFGAPPPALGDSPEDAQTLQSIYVSQIATLVWTHDPLTTAKPVVVALALKKSPGPASDNGRREVFLGVMKAVLACLKQRQGGSGPSDDFA
ncbi:hypothetical protein AURDEDRAFT_188863 [Auricularia subglabra TFB-10046 SS5]|nr:hypothetical protein AURDEDRAFT_188863 [Auricularia subglabra TFB-10046 SS5]